jgi:SAM-dependent methyltransferase
MNSAPAWQHLETDMPDKHHWENVYANRAIDAVSWYQAHAERSVDLIRKLVIAKDDPIIDVGGGASVLVDDLLAEHYADLTVLDLSGAALAAARARLGAVTTPVRWIEGDVTTAALPQARYALWHDRAVFHFLTTPEQREAYVRQVLHAVRPGGHVIVATFAEDGPTECSGLPVVRYDAEHLHGEFGAPFELLGHEREEHVTPAGRVQSFLYCFCRRSHS